MRKIFFLLLAGVCGGGLVARAQENLVANPGFEAGSTADGLPAGGWWLSKSVGDPVIKVDRTVAHHGQVSVRMEAPGEEKCVLVCKKIEVAPGDGLRFEVWVRGANLPAGQKTAYAGLVFRSADARVLERHYVSSTALSGEWSRISGTAQAPVEAVAAEVHLGYTNGPGTIWYDDLTVAITNALSLSIVDGAKPWPGAQEITVRAANRLSTEFRGSISAQIGNVTKSVPIALGPKAAQNFQVPIFLNGAGQHAYKISLLDHGGIAVKFIQGKFKTAPPLVLFPPDPCYQLIGSGKADTLIAAQVNLDPARRVGMKLNVTVLGSDGHELQTVMTAVAKGDITDVHVSIPTSAAGVFGIRAGVVEPEGHQIASAESDVHVIAPGIAQVRVGPDGFLRVGGKPEFPIGLYSSSRDEELSWAGFNATHNYNVSGGDIDEAINHTEPQLKELLDAAWASKLRMMVELPRKAIEKGQWAQVRRRIETFRHHPGLLCWGSEERVARGMTKPANIAALYALVHELDPDHPLVLGDTRDVIEKFKVDRRDFFPDALMDVGIWWWYPIPVTAKKANALEGTEATGEVMESPSWLTTTHSKKPLWIAIQSYQKPQKDARFPTPAEYRCQAYLSIIYGVKGLFFYTGSGQKDFEGKPSGILNKPELGHWDYVKQLTGELRDFSPEIMAPPAAGKLQLTPTNSPVEFATRELDGKYYLIAANKSAQPQNAHWQGDLMRDKKARTMFEDHPFKLEGDTLSDNFPAFGVHVYKLE